MVLINRLSRSNGVKTVRNSNALVTKIAVKPTLSTIASDRSTSAEMVAGDSTRAKVPAMNTAPLIRQTRQYSGSVVGVVTSSAYEDRKWVLARIDRRQEIVKTRLHGTVHLILLAACASRHQPVSRTGGNSWQPNPARRWVVARIA
jgi:hypothetical protein